MTPAAHRITMAALRWLLAVVLLWAAVSKLADLGEFYASVSAYELPVSRVVLRLFAVTLPWLELLCGVLLIMSVWTEAALACASVLMLLFAVATGQALFRGLDISCGCFDMRLVGLHEGSLPAVILESVGFALLRNLLLLALTCYLLAASWRSVPSHGERATSD